MTPDAQSVQDRAWSVLVDHLEFRPPRRAKRWREARDRLLQDMGPTAFRSRLAAELDSSEDAPYSALLPVAASVEPDDRLISALGSRAERSLRRVPQHGPANRTLATLCIKTLAAYDTRGAPELERLRQVVKYPSARDRIDAALDRIATSHRASRQELEELTVPHHGLDSAGRLVRRVGDATAYLALDHRAQLRLRWQTDSGRRQKTPPIALRRDWPNEVDAVLELERRIRHEVVAQAKRLERLLREGRSWSFAAWSVRYVDSPLVAALTRRLIWRFESDTQTTEGIWLDGEWSGLDDEMLHDLEACRVSLWHPAEADENRRTDWRHFIATCGIRQPFRQADREIFVHGREDGPDPDCSTRFAGRLVYQQQFAALARQRSWEYTLQGPYHSADTADLRLPELGLEVNLHAPHLDPYSTPDGPVDDVVCIGALQFIDDRESVVPVVHLPAATFSEVMRDVSLFVEVAAAPTNQR